MVAEYLGAGEIQDIGNTIARVSGTFLFGHAFVKYLEFPQ